MAAHAREPGFYLRFGQATILSGEDYSSRHGISPVLVIPSRRVYFPFPTILLQAQELGLQSFIVARQVNPATIEEGGELLIKLRLVLGAYVEPYHMLGEHAHGELTPIAVSRASAQAIFS
jgi:hypothetical protein